MKEERALAVRTPLLPSKREKEALMTDYLKAGLVRSDEFGAATNMAAEYLAIVALVHGLDPVLKEVSVWPIRRQVQGQWKVVGIETHIGVYGYQRQADDRARAGDDYNWGKMDVLSKEEKLARLSHKCPKCSGTGKTGSAQCNRCGGKGEFDADSVIVVKREIYLRRQLQVALEFKIPPEPIIGYGVFRPGDSIPEGRDAMWRAESRATKDCFKKAYALDFWLPTASMLDYKIEGESSIVVSEDMNGEVEIIDSEEVERVFEEQVAAENKGLSEEEVLDEQPELIGLKQLGFGDTPSTEHITEARKRLAELGYPTGKPQLGLIQSLYGDINWGSITGGQLWNMLAYASKAMQFDDTKSSKETKDALKEECRKYVRAGKFWVADE